MLVSPRKTSRNHGTIPTVLSAQLADADPRWDLLPDVFSSRHAGALGIGPSQLRTAAKWRHILSVRRGAYIKTHAWNQSGAQARYVLTVQAILAASPQLVASHESALALAGLPLLDPAHERVHVVSQSAKRSSDDMLVRYRHSDLSDTVRNQVTHQRVPVEYALIQIASRGDILSAVVLGDAALRSNLVTHQMVRRAAEMTSLTRRSVIERAVRMMNPLSASMDESILRGSLIERGFEVAAHVALRSRAENVTVRVPLLVSQNNRKNQWIGIAFDDDWLSVVSNQSMMPNHQQNVAVVEGIPVLRIERHQITSCESIASQVLRVLSTFYPQNQSRRRLVVKEYASPPSENDHSEK